jgi:hypothetical protein
VEKANIVKDSLKDGVHRKKLHDKKYITLLYFLECVEANYVKSFEKRRRRKLLYYEQKNSFEYDAPAIHFKNVRRKSEYCPIRLQTFRH